MYSPSRYFAPRYFARRYFAGISFVEFSTDVTAASEVNNPSLGIGTEVSSALSAASSVAAAAMAVSQAKASSLSADSSAAQANLVASQAKTSSLTAESSVAAANLATGDSEAGGYFSTKYFTPRYFPPRYFSGGDTDFPFAEYTTTLVAESSVSTITLSSVYVVLDSPGVTDITDESARPGVALTYGNEPTSGGTLYYGVFFAFAHDEITWNRVDGWSEYTVAAGSEPARTTSGTQAWATAVALSYDNEGYVIAFVWDDGTDTSPVVVSASFLIEAPFVAPEFVLEACCADFTYNSYRLTGTVQNFGNHPGAVYAVAILPADAVPTAEQIVLGQNGSGVAARGSSSASGVTDSFELTLSGLFGELTHNIHAVFEAEVV